MTVRVKRFTRAPIGVMLMSLIAWGTAYGDWFDPDWTYRKSVQFQASQVSGDLNGFPALVSIQDAELQAAAQAGGEDIVFALEDGTQLPHEIERYDGSTGELVAWVQVPLLSSTNDTEVFLYYGNPGAGDQQAPTDVWDSGFRLVQHLEETGGRNSPLADSTQYGNGGTVLGQGGNFPGYLAGGAANGSRAHPGQPSPGNSPDPVLSFDHFGNPGLSSAFTAEVWARVDNNQSGRDHHPIFWKGDVIGWGASYLFRIAMRSNRTVTWGVTCGGSEEWFDGGSAGQDWSHYAISFDGNTTRAYIDGQLVATDNGCSGRSLNVTSRPFQSGHASVDNGQESFLNGDVDELRVSTLARSENWLRAHFNNVDSPSTFHVIGPEETDVLIDHFEIVHDGIALTCQPETVTLRACENSDCSTLYTDPVEATLAPPGWVGGDTFTFSGGQTTRPLQVTTPDTVSLDVVSSDPSTRAFTGTLCDDGSGSFSGANCELEFVESGLAFNVPDLLSHRPSGSIEVRAVRQDPQTEACVPAFENVQRSVQFWSTYVNPGPNGRPVSRPVSVDGANISGDQTSPTPLDLDFGPGGIAEVEVTYPDAGQMQLDARYVGSSATNDDGLVMPGADGFISRPAGLCVTTAGTCPAGDATCPLFARADEEFDLLLTAMGWESNGDTNLCQGNPVTPNFSLLNIPLTSQVVAPAGGEEGDFNPVSYSHGRSVDATETVSARVSEVGVFQFTATPETGGYLGLTVTGGTSAPTGRFYPDAFNVNVDPGELEAECTDASPFVYTGQDFGWFTTASVQIEPLSVLGSRTENYTATGFQRLDKAGVDRSFPVQDSTETDSSGNPLVVNTTPAPGTLVVVAPGLLQYQYSLADVFVYTKSSATRITPFGPDLDLSVDDIIDSDGVSASAPPYMFKPVAAFEIRYGRLSMDNVYGPENISELPMPFRLEYWNGSRFVVNVADSCTPWTTANITSSTPQHHTLAPDSGTVSAGEAGPLSLQPAGSQGTDTLTWAVDDWLKGDADEDGTLEDPSALATFGVYRGHDRVIYWQEK